MVSAIAYYRWPAVWIDGSPESPDMNINFERISEEVFRTSLSGGITAKVLREGLFVFDFTGWKSMSVSESKGQSEADKDEARIRECLEVLNTHLLCFDSSLVKNQKFLLDKMIVSRKEVMTFPSLDDNKAVGFVDQRLAHLALTRYRSTYSQNLITDWRILGRVSVNLDTVEDSFRRLDVILSKADGNLLFITDLFARTCKAHYDESFDVCLIMAWTLLEECINVIWDGYLKENRKRRRKGGTVRFGDKVIEIPETEYSFISGKRRDTLTGRDYSASIIIEILSLVDAITFEQYTDLSKIRKIRNDWIHQLKPVSREQAQEAINLAANLIKSVWSIEFSPNVGFKSVGF